MLIKIHSGYRKTIALLDTNLLNQTFTEDNKEITLHEHFFKGEEKTKQELIPILQDLQKEDATFNIVGKKSIQTSIEAGIIKQEGIMTIDDIPIALVLL
jgi:hypothetical protein